MKYMHLHHDNHQQDSEIKCCRKVATAPWATPVHCLLNGRRPNELIVLELVVEPKEQTEEVEEALERETPREPDNDSAALVFCRRGESRCRSRFCSWAARLSNLRLIKCTLTGEEEVAGQEWFM